MRPGDSGIVANMLDRASAIFQSYNTRSLVESGGGACPAGFLRTSTERTSAGKKKGKNIVNLTIEITQRTPVFLFVSLLVCFIIPSTAHAISPPPDGCYPAFTTAEGCSALQSLTTG